MVGARLEGDHEMSPSEEELLKSIQTILYSTEVRLPEVTTSVYPP